MMMKSSSLVFVVLIVIVVLWIVTRVVMRHSIQTDPTENKPMNLENFNPLYDISNVDLIGRKTNIGPIAEPFKSEQKDTYESDLTEDIPNKMEDKDSLNTFLRNKVPDGTEDEKELQYKALFERPVATGLKRTRRIKVSN